MRFNSLSDIEAAVSGLSPIQQSQAFLDQVGDDIRGDQDKVYTSDPRAQQKYSYAEVQALADQIANSGIQLQKDNKFYDTGNSQVNEALYGPDISRNLSGDGTAGFRTPRQFDPNYVGEALAAIPFATAAWATGGALGNALPGLLGDGALGQIATTAIKNEATGAIRDAGDFSNNAGQMNITGGQTTQGGMVDLGETENPANEGWLDGLLSAGGGMSLPIPGLPVSLPGNMTIGDLMDIAKASGVSIMDVIRDMGESGESSGNVPVTGDIEDDGRIGGGGLVLGRDPVESPTEVVTEAPIEPPSVTPIETPNDPVSDPVGDSEQPTSPYDPTWPDWWENPPEVQQDDPTPPVAGVSGGDIAAGLGLILPGLIALQNDPAPTPEYEMWDYIGPDTSYGYETPDYGQVTQKPLYDFAKQPSQPNQVGYQPDPRRDYLNVLQQEQRRRQQIGLLG